jgi:hypothetical protein
MLASAGCRVAFPGFDVVADDDGVVSHARAALLGDRLVLAHKWCWRQVS